MACEYEEVPMVHSVMAARGMWNTPQPPACEARVPTKWYRLSITTLIRAYWAPGMRRAARLNVCVDLVIPRQNPSWVSSPVPGAQYAGHAAVLAIPYSNGICHHGLMLAAFPSTEQIF